MHPIDIAVTVVLTLFAIRGYARGLLHEVMSLAAFLTGSGVALRWTPKLAARIAESVPGPAMTDHWLGFIILFGLTVMTGRLIISLVERLWGSAENSGINRLAGTAFSIFKGGVLVGCVVLTLRAIPPEGGRGGSLRGRVTSPVSQVNDRIEGSFLAARLADLTGGLFSALMDSAGANVRTLADDEQERP